MEDKKWREKTKLDKVDRNRLLFNILMIIVSIITGILEKDFTWGIIALLWGSIAIEECLNSKILKGKDYINNLLAEQIKKQDEIIKEYLSHQVKNIKDIKVPKYFSKPNENKMLESWEYVKKNGIFRTPIIIDKNNNLKDGYTSYLIAKSLNMEEIIVKVVE